ncbi:hypothetical protein NDU88_006684 [Pleurodeles waltl]|uniref:Reverse transcriptase domain-containing protein n=1 Tax=Pleurodeles waltl TaxID=8319 RepID=A0AAV7X3E4_PLEWA|nr:hypothetical protein NDU88_006684 [Pleurodeles waltl]
MVTCFAPSFMCMFLGWWEQQVSMDPDTFEDMYGPILWLRYLDDLFIMWKGTENSATEFVNKLRVNILNVEFTTNISREKVEFLDVEVTIVGNGCSLWLETHRCQEASVEIRQPEEKKDEERGKWLVSLYSIRVSKRRCGLVGKK